jgi:pyrroloquinoline quinone (PQQ) biosynthesis protein C
LDGRLAERLLHAWAKDRYHHLLECTKKSFVVLAQNEIRRIPEYLQAFLSLLLGGGVALP